jgi:hypothetical protein
VSNFNELVIKVNSMHKNHILPLFNSQTLASNEMDKRIFVEAFYKLKTAEALMKRASS